MNGITKLAEHLTLARDLSPEGRSIEERGRFRQAWRAVSSNFGKAIVINLMMMLFALPLLIVFFVYMPQYEQQQILANGLNFSGGFGIGYGVSNDTLEGIRMVYEIRQFFVLCGIIPGFLLVGLGLSGGYYCCRNLLWGAKVNVFKHFLRGIARGWYKFLISFGVLGAIVTGLLYSLFEVLKQTALYGGAGAGVWVGLVFACIGALAVIMYLSIALPMFVQYKFKYKDAIKNSLITVLIMFLMTLMVVVLMAAPMALAFIEFMRIIIYLIILVIGGSIYVTFDLAYGQFVGDTFIGALYEREQTVKRKEQEKSARQKTGNRSSDRNKKGKRKK